MFGGLVVWFQLIGIVLYTRRHRREFAPGAFVDAESCAPQGFTPFGELVSESDISLFENKVNAEYGEKANQNKIISEGNMLYLQKAFPHMSYIKTESVEVVTA